MAIERETPEKQDQDARDAAERTPTTETTETEVRDAGQEKDQKWEEALKWKEKAERVNELERENQELRARTQPPAATRADSDPSEERRRKLEEFARQGDVAAQEALELRRQRDLDRKEQADYNQLINMEHADGSKLTKAEKESVAKHYLANPYRFGDPQAAYADLNAPKLAEEVSRLRKENESLKKKPDPNVIRTHEREGPSPAGKSNVETETREEFNRKLKAMDPFAGMQYRQRILDGTLVVKS